jgi:methionyl-tRNA formyltransferase
MGGKLLVEAVQTLKAGTFLRQPQPLGFTSDPWPRDADFELDVRWSARHAFNFMRGTGNWERPYAVRLDGRRVWLETAVSYQPDAQLPQPLIHQSDDVFLQFSPGVLRATLAK